jgi:uncharacterized membrane protein
LTKNQAFSNQVTKQTKRTILQTIKQKKPKNAKELITLIKEKTALPQEEITRLLLELENENELHFTKKEIVPHLASNSYFRTTKALWYWVIIALSIATTLAVFTIPDSAYPIMYVRSVLGAIFVLLLPGYSLIKVLYPSQVPMKTSGGYMDNVERLALSFGLSLALVSITGLILNYTPWGVSLTPVTLSLLAFTIVFATAAVLREYQAKTQVVKEFTSP